MHAKLLKSLLLCLAVSVAAPAEGRDLRAVARTLKKRVSCTQYAETTNYARNSETVNDWLGGGTVSVNQCADAAGAMTLDLVSGSFKFNNALAMSASVGPTTASAEFRSSSGTQTGMVAAVCKTGTATACTCGRSDGGSVSTCAVWAGDARYCQAVASFTTAATVRLWATVTCSETQTTVDYYVAGGPLGGAYGSVCAGRAQVERQASVTPYAGPVTATAVTRAAGCY